MGSRSTFEPIDGGGTKLTIGFELPDSVMAFDASFVERSLRNMKQLIETET